MRVLTYVHPGMHMCMSGQARCGARLYVQEEELCEILYLYKSLRAERSSCSQASRDLNGHDLSSSLLRIVFLSKINGRLWKDYASVHTVIR